LAARFVYWQGDRLDGSTLASYSVRTCTLTACLHINSMPAPGEDDCIITACLYFLGRMIALLQHAGNSAAASSHFGGTMTVALESRLQLGGTLRVLAAWYV
jgi:hypothetical protein